MRNVVRYQLFFCSLLLGGVVPSIALAQPVKVYILAGQSNMQGHADVRTLEHLAMSADSKPLWERLHDSKGNPRVADRIWISYLSRDGIRAGKLTTGFGASENKIGPEFSFGFSLEQRSEGPILLIKTAWGGKSLHTDFRPPSAGRYEFTEAQKEQFKKQGKDLQEEQASRDRITGQYYRQMIEHVRSVLKDLDSVMPAEATRDGYELAGFVWFQGWNDMVDRGVYPDRDKAGGYSAYSDVLAHFIRDVRRDLEAPDLPFVIGVMGVNGPTDQYSPKAQRYRKVHQNFRDAMAATAKQPEFRESVTNVLTEQAWDPELSRLRSREGDLRQQWNKFKESNPGMSRQEQEAAKAKRWAEAFTPEELKTLKVGVSNAEYHYLGSAKILARIGEMFAEAVSR